MDYISHSTSASLQRKVMTPPIHTARLILSKMMDLPMTHRFPPERHLTRHECAIHKKPGNHKSETMIIVHIVEATENQTLKG
jgi:hypothetical protein